MERDNQPLDVLTQNRLCEEVRENHTKFGRNFLNMFRQKLEHEDREVSGETFLVEPDLEKLIDRFRGILQTRTVSTAVWQFQFYFVVTTTNCEIKEELISAYKRTEDKKDWIKWHRDLMDQCKSLKQKFPYHFGILLSSFLNPLDEPLMNGKLRLRVLKRDEDERELKVEDWAVLEQRLEDYKNNKNIGYLLGILDYWLQEAESGLSHFLEGFPLLRVEQPKNQMKTLKTSPKPSFCDNCENKEAKIPEFDFVELGPNIRQIKKKTEVKNTSVPSGRSLGAFPTRCKGFAEYYQA